MTYRRDTVTTTTSTTALPGPVRWWLLALGALGVLTLLTWGFASSVQRAAVSTADDALEAAGLSGVEVSSATYRDVTLSGPATDEQAARDALAGSSLVYGVKYETSVIEEAPLPSEEATHNATEQASEEATESASADPSVSPDPLEIDALPDLSGVQFETESATLTAPSTVVLDAAAIALIGALDEHPGLKVSIEGHTDDQGDDALNLSLSQQRAEVVRDYLTARGVPADILTATGYGETRPVADNATSDGRAANRRVDFIMTEG